jgi:hypothetical protein
MRTLPTHALTPSSPAVDAGNNAACPMIVRKMTFPEKGSKMPYETPLMVVEIIFEVKAMKIEVGSYMVIDPEIYHGQMTFKGTRIPVDTVLTFVGKGHSVDQLLRSWP